MSTQSFYAGTGTRASYEQVSEVICNLGRSSGILYQPNTYNRLCQFWSTQNIGENLMVSTAEQLVWSHDHTV